MNHARPIYILVAFSLINQCDRINKEDQTSIIHLCYYESVGAGLHGIARVMRLANVKIFTSACMACASARHRTSSIDPVRFPTRAGHCSARLQDWTRYTILHVYNGKIMRYNFSDPEVLSNKTLSIMKVNFVV